jgi:hypothetical protein
MLLLRAVEMLNEALRRRKSTWIEPTVSKEGHMQQYSPAADKYLRIKTLGSEVNKQELDNSTAKIKVHLRTALPSARLHRDEGLHYNAFHLII